MCLGGGGWKAGCDQAMLSMRLCLKKTTGALQQRQGTSHPGNIFMYRNLSPTRTQTRNGKRGNMFPGIQNPYKENQYRFKKEKVQIFFHTIDFSQALS